MAHFSTTQLHEIHYGFLSPDPHFEDCPTSREALKKIEREGESLRKILRTAVREEAAVIPPREERIQFLFGLSLAGIASAAAFVGILLYVKSGSRQSGAPAG